MYQQASRSRPPAQTSFPPASAPSGPPAAPATASSPAPPPPQVSSVPVEKPTAAAPPNVLTEADPREQKLAGLRQDARDQFQRGQRTALGTVLAGLKIAPDDSELQAIMDSILTDARRIAGRSKEAATIAGAPKYATPIHQEALKLERDASQQIAAGRKDVAIRTLWRAEETFDRAERDARLERARLEQLQDEKAAKQRLAGPPASGQPRTPEPAPPPRPRPNQPPAISKRREWRGSFIGTPPPTVP